MGEDGAVVPAPNDRRVGLIVFGVLEFLLAGFCLMEVCALGLALLIGDKLPAANREQLNLRMLWPGLLLYLGLAALFISLGTGSVLCRRWARTLLYVLSVGWLAVGVPATLFMAVTIPRMMAAMPAQPGLDPAARKAMFVFVTLFTVAFMAILLIAIPLALFLFYRSPHVKATCEARDPRPRWTDACPPVVLGLSLLFVFSGVVSLLNVTVYRAIPLFGWLLDGLAGKAAIVLLSGACIALGWHLYHMRPWAFWVAVAFSGAWVVSGGVSAARLGMEGLLSISGQAADPQTLALMRSIPSWTMVGVCAVTLALWSVLFWAAGRAILKQPAHAATPPAALPSEG